MIVTDGLQRTGLTSDYGKISVKAVLQNLFVSRDQRQTYFDGRGHQEPVHRISVKIAWEKARAYGDLRGQWSDLNSRMVEDFIHPRFDGHP